MSKTLKMIFFRCINEKDKIQTREMEEDIIGGPFLTIQKIIIGKNITDPVRIYEINLVVQGYFDCMAGKSMDIETISYTEALKVWYNNL